MSSLLKIRSERDQMSAIERRIADYILDNAHLLRDYSSQQLADALGISQSSVVKFSQKLGFKGYPDLKYSVGESMARDGGDAAPRPAVDDATGPHAALAEALWREKARAEQETRLINPPERLDALADAIAAAGTVFVTGLGQDGIPARAFAMKLSMLGILAVHHFDALLLPASLSAAGPGDLLLVFSEHGTLATLCQASRQFRSQGGAVACVTRHSANPLRALSSLCLLVSAHSEHQHLEPLLYQSALEHLLDLVFVLLCGDADRLHRFAANQARVLADT